MNTLTKLNKNVAFPQKKTLNIFCFELEFGTSDLKSRGTLYAGQNW